MAKKEGGFGFGTIIMGIIFYNIFFGTDDNDTEMVVETQEEEIQIVETVKEHIKELEPELDKLTRKAKQEFAELKQELSQAADEKETEKAKNSTTEKAKNDPTPSPKDDDPFGQEDLYGSSEDKY